MAAEATIADLPSRLWELANLGIDQFEGWKDDGNFSKDRIFVADISVDDFEYIDGRANTESVSYGSGRTAKWPDGNQKKFFEQKIEGKNAFDDTVELIQQVIGEDREQADRLARHFLHDTIDEYWKNDIEKDEIVRRVHSFITDIKDGPKERSLKVWLDGLSLEPQRVDLSDNTVLRRPTSEDLEINARHPFFGGAEDAPDSDPTAIAEIQVHSANEQDLEHRLDRILDVLSLYSLGSVRPLRKEFEADSVIEGAKKTVPETLDSIHRYWIKEGEEGRLSDFASAVWPQTPLGASKGEEEEVLYLDVAFDRYRDALFEQRVENRVTSSITSLEATFLKAKERSELSHRLAQRISLLLSELGEPPVKMYNQVSRAYDIRSSFVHGEELPRDKKKEANTLSEKILNYARTSLAILYQLEEARDKEKFLNRLDHALLDDNAREKVSSGLEEGIIFPELDGFEED